MLKKNSWLDNSFALPRLVNFMNTQILEEPSEPIRLPSAYLPSSVPISNYLH